MSYCSRKNLFCQGVFGNILTKTIQVGYYVKGTLFKRNADPDLRRPYHPGSLVSFIGYSFPRPLVHRIWGIYQLTAPLQMLSLSAAAFGIQTAVSKLCAAHMAVGKSRDARDTFLLGAGLSLFLSVFLAWILYHNAGFFAVEILKEERTEPFIRLLSLGLPFSSLHICVNGYYYAGNKTGIPSAIQLMEQLVRVGGTFSSLSDLSV